jgi:hypothetical protein
MEATAIRHANLWQKEMVFCHNPQCGVRGSYKWGLHGSTVTSGWVHSLEPIDGGVAARVHLFCSARCRDAGCESPCTTWSRTTVLVRARRLYYQVRMDCLNDLIDEVGKTNPKLPKIIESVSPITRDVLVYADGSVEFIDDGDA